MSQVIDDAMLHDQGILLEYPRAPQDALDVIIGGARVRNAGFDVSGDFDTNGGMLLQAIDVN